MLEVMRRHAYSWGTRIVLGFLAVIFAFWGIGAGLFAQVKPVAEEARHLGLSITNEALQQKIATTPQFQRGGQFDLETYQDLLRSNNLLPNEYENGIRGEMLQETLRNMIDSSIQVSDGEVRHA